MAYKRKPSAKELVVKITEAKGNISAVARAYHVSRTTVYGWIRESTAALQALSDERETMVDVAESILYRRAAIDMDMTAVAYILNNMREAKTRGWGPRHEIAGADGSEIVVRIEYTDEKTTP